MNPPAQPSFGRWLTRILAVLAVAAAALALFLVISSSLETGEDAKTTGKGPDRTQTQDQTAETYVIQPGDTLAGIAAEVGVPVERLEDLNPEIDPQALPSGGTLKLR